MGRNLLLAVTTLLACSTSMLVCPSAGAADDLVTYEIVSDTVGIVNIKYMDSQRRVLLEGVPVPWRMETVVPAAIEKSELRADWRPSARPNRWVTVRIIYQGEVICQSTLDIGNATCYGNTPHRA
jgi:hypothetical protein